MTPALNSFFFIIKLRNQLVFNVSRNQTSNILFDNRRLYRLSKLKFMGS